LGEDTALVLLAGSIEAALLLGEKDLVAKLSPVLRPAAYMAFTHGQHLSSPARILGDSAMMLGQFGQARDFYDLAVTNCKKVGFRPELAVSSSRLAELLLEHYPDERDAAIEHLDFAISEFREMKMQPSLERALRHRGLLKA
jgi:hypothetical protein